MVRLAREALADAGLSGDAKIMDAEELEFPASTFSVVLCEKTRISHIDEGFEFLGWRIQCRVQRGRTGKTAIYTYPSKKSMTSIKDKVREQTRRAKHRTLADLLRRLNPVLRGRCQLLPSRGVQTHLRLRRPLRLLADRRLAEEAAPRAEHAHPGSPQSPRLGDRRRRD
jgi:hypothetical protein